MLTRKDYNETAQILNKFLDKIDSEDFNDLVFEFSEWFAEDNPNFSEEIFLDKIYGKVK